MSRNWNQGLLKRVSSLVEDEPCSVVTYKTVCRKYDVSVNDAKSLLESYLTIGRKKFQGTIVVLYTLIGKLQAPNGDLECHVVVVEEGQVAEWQEKLAEVTKHIYSVQTMELDDFVPIHLADNPISIEDVRALRESSTIGCSYILPRNRNEQPRNLVAAVTMTSKTLIKLENEEKKIMSAVGVSIGALRIKSSGNSQENAAAPEIPAVPRVREKKLTLAPWIKSSTLDPKKTPEIKKMVEDKRKPIVPAAKRSSQNSDSSDDDFLAPKRARPFPVRSMMESDDSDMELPIRCNDNELNDMPIDEPPASNRTMSFGANSDEEPAITPRKTTKAGKQTQKPSKNEVEANDPDSDVEVIPAEKSVKTGGGSKVSKTSGELTAVSDDESGPSWSIATTVAAASKEITLKKKRTRIASASDDDFVEEEKVPQKKESNSKGKKASSSSAGKKNAVVVKESDDDEDFAKEEKPRKTAKASEVKRGKKHAKKQDNSGEEGDGVGANSSDEQSNTRKNFKTAPVQKKRAKKALGNDDSDHEDAIRSPSRECSPEEPAPLRQFLKPTVTTSSGQKKRKQVLKTSVDKDGYTVNEKVWIEVSDDDETENSAQKPAEVVPLKTVKSGTVTQNATELKKSAAKKSNGGSSQGKAVQSSIMSFFKKAN